MYRFLPLTLALLFLTAILRAQSKPATFGELRSSEKSFVASETDPDAAAVILYERGDNYFEIIKNYIMLVKKYHVRIKILDEKGFEEGTISIPYYRGDKSSEKVDQIRAITHNGDHRTFVPEENIFTRDRSPRVMEKVFTFPDLKVGTILEYEYTLISPFFFTLTGWNFQSHLPTVYSEFHATIPAYFTYNRNLTGSLPLQTNDSRLLRECFRLPGTLRAADCEVLTYIMTDVPAFKEEGYMLAPSNYIASIDFELAEHRRPDGVTDRYTETWEDVDDDFKNDRNLGIQLTKKGYFERHVPASLLSEGDHLTRARNIFNFTRDHYTWTGEYGIHRNVRVKEAFDAGKGNIGEINLSLINLLNAADIPARMMLLSTRAHGLPTRSHPVMSDFNYVIARAEIAGKTYLLDASDPFVPFGMLPFRCLNYYGRVMDFQKESYWENIQVDEPNRVMVRAQLTFDPAMTGAQGVLDEINLGYEAISRRKDLAETSEEAYLDQKEQEMQGDYEITEYALKEDLTDEKKVTERFNLDFAPELMDGKLYFNPFLVVPFRQESFTQEKRQYPVDFGYARTYSYTVSVVLPEGYGVEKLPDPGELNLADQVASLKFTAGQSGNNLSFMFTLSINRSHVDPKYYRDLKEMFEKVNEIQKNALVVIHKES